MRCHTWAMFLAVFVLVGCSAERPELPVVPVQGQVLVNGAPAEQVIVAFRPVDQGPAKRLAGQATSGPDGQFRVTTYRPEDGIATGNYLVTFVWPDPRKPGENAPDLFRGRYRDPHRSTIHVTIPAEGGTLPPFQLKK